MKYEIRVCNCGRIHAFPHEKIENAIYNNKELLLICSGCGASTVIGADYRPDGAYGSNEPCYDMYSFTLDKTCSIKSDFKTPDGHEISEILFDEGIKVPMMSGEYAGLYTPGAGFSDIWFPDLYKIEAPGTTMKDVAEFIAKYRKDRKTVNMNRLINENNNPEILKAISSRLIEGLDWTDTEYENWWMKHDEPEPKGHAEKTNLFGSQQVEECGFVTMAIIDEFLQDSEISSYIFSKGNDSFDRAIEILKSKPVSNLNKSDVLAILRAEL